MSMLEREIKEFGRRMGMPGFALSQAGIAALDIEKFGRLYLEEGSEELLVYLVAPVAPHDHSASRRILELCGYKNAHPMPLSGGLHADGAVLLTRMAVRDVTTAALENAVDYLGRMMEQIMK